MRLLETILSNGYTDLVLDSYDYPLYYIDELIKKYRKNSLFFSGLKY